MRHYLGDDGILRIIRGYYAPESLEAAMLGCIQAHDTEFWFTQIGNEFDADNRSERRRFALLDGLRRADVISDFPDERLSDHKRASGSPIRVFHLFIDCTGNEPLT
jgi:hypothetical protein